MIVSFSRDEIKDSLNIIVYWVTSCDFEKKNIIISFASDYKSLDSNKQ